MEKLFSLSPVFGKISRNVRFKNKWKWWAREQKIALLIPKSDDSDDDVLFDFFGEAECESKRAFFPPLPVGEREHKKTALEIQAT